MLDILAAIPDKIAHDPAFARFLVAEILIAVFGIAAVAYLIATRR